MADEKIPPATPPGAVDPIYTELQRAVDELNEIRGVCELAYERSRTESTAELWTRGEFPFALGTVMGRTWQALSRLEQLYGLVPGLVDYEQRAKRGRELVEEFRRRLHEDFGASR